MFIEPDGTILYTQQTAKLGNNWSKDIRSQNQPGTVILTMAGGLTGRNSEGVPDQLSGYKFSVNSKQCQGM